MSHVSSAVAGKNAVSSEAETQPTLETSVRFGQSRYVPWSVPPSVYTSPQQHGEPSNSLQEIGQLLFGFAICLNAVGMCVRAAKDLKKDL
jgi:hypothetical protein